MSPEKKQRFLLFLILVGVGVAVGFISIHGLYKVALKEEKYHLSMMVKSWARLIESIAEFDKKYSQNYSEGTTEATLSQIRKAHGEISFFENSGEFTLAQLKDGKIIFLLQNGLLKKGDKREILYDSKLAEPTRLALKGQSGTMIGLDYRGMIVMAAYEPVSILNMGLVAKVDLKEIKEPFVKAGWMAGSAGIFIILIGGYLFLRTSEPLINNLIKLNKDLDKTKNQYADLYDNAPDMFFSVEASTGKIVNCNQTMINKTGYLKKEIIGKQTLEMYHPSCLPKAKNVFNCFLTLGVVKNEELFLLRKDGTSIPVILNVSSIRDDSGKPIYSRSVCRDISDLKESENKLKVSEERLQRAVKGSQDGMWDWPDIKKDEIWWSPQVYFLLGYEDLEIPASVPQFKKLLHPLDLDKVEKTLQAHFEKKVPYDIEYRLQTKSGEYRWFCARGQTICDEDGNPVRMSGSIQDIHEKVLAEKSLNQSEKKLREIIENMPILICALDQNWNVIVWNKECEKVTGYQREEVIDNPKAAEFLFFEKINRKEIFLDWNNEGKNIDSRVIKLKSKDQVLKTISWTNISDKFPIKDWALWGMGFDITEKIILNETIQKLSRAVEQSPVSIEITDKDGNIEYVNPCFCTTTGYSSEEVIGKKPNILKSGSHSEKFYQDLWVAISSGKEWRGELHNKKEKWRIVLGVGDNFWSQKCK